MPENKDIKREKILLLIMIIKKTIQMNIANKQRVKSMVSHSSEVECVLLVYKKKKTENPTGHSRSVQDLPPKAVTKIIVRECTSLVKIYLSLTAVFIFHRKLRQKEIVGQLDV